MKMLNICRVCEAKENLIDINNHTNDTIMDKLTNVANVSYSEDDELPKQVCQQCHTDIELFHLFKIKCEATDRKLRNALQKQKLNVSSLSLPYGLGIDFLKKEECLDPEIIIKTEDDPQTFENIFADTLDTSFDINYCEKPDKPTVHYFDAIEPSLEQKENKKLKYKLPCSTISKPKPIKKTIHCGICNKPYNSKSALTNHKNFEHDNVAERKRIGEIRQNATFECLLCRKTFLGIRKLKKHLISHANKGKLRSQCKICFKRFANHACTRRHMSNIHEGIRSFQCYVCGKRFAQEYGLVNHMYTHKSDRPFSCHLCWFSAKSEYFLKMHMKNHERKNYRPTKRNYCVSCGKQSPNNYAHTVHMRSHTGEKPYECSECGKCYSNIKVLRKHSLIHTTEKSFECGICGTKFRQNAHLRTHMSKHMEKTEKCTFCSKSFALAERLAVHIRLHTGETPYSCTDCDYKVHSLNSLKRHKRLNHNSKL